MRERVYQAEALILRRRNFGEADRILLLATPSGKRHVIARGVRKITSRLAGHIELFFQTRMWLARGRNLDIVTQSQVHNAFPTLRSDLDRLAAGYYVAELYDRMTQQEEENTRLFQLLVATLSALDNTRNPDLVLRAYELRLLHNAGYRPHLHTCPVSAVRLPPDANRFSPRLGGVLAPAAAQADPYALPIDAPTFRLLRYLQTESFAAIERLTISAEVRTQARELLQAYIRHLVERDLKTTTFLDQLNELNSQHDQSDQSDQSDQPSASLGNISPDSGLPRSPA